MNAARRKATKEIFDQLSELKERIELLEEEETEAFDNLPENMQEGERGQQMEDNIGDYQSAVSSVEDAMENLETLFN